MMLFLEYQSSQGTNTIARIKGPPRVQKPIAGIPSKAEALKHHPGKQILSPYSTGSIKGYIDIETLLPHAKDSPVHLSGESPNKSNKISTVKSQMIKYQMTHQILTNNQISSK
jgi:hypothetical protein